jgi:hypothetical protein
MALHRDQARRLALANGAARCALGITALAVPSGPLTPWVGGAGGTQAVRLLARALGGRDLAIGAGTLLALRRGGTVRGWVEAAGLADAGDVLVTAGAFASLPRRGRWAVLAAATAGVVAAALTARHVDQPADARPEGKPPGSAPGAVSSGFAPCTATAPG